MHPASPPLSFTNDSKNYPKYLIESVLASLKHCPASVKLDGSRKMSSIFHEGIYRGNKIVNKCFWCKRCTVSTLTKIKTVDILMSLNDAVKVFT